MIKSLLSDLNILLPCKCLIHSGLSGGTKQDIFYFKIGIDILISMYLVSIGLHYSKYFVFILKELATGIKFNT